MSHKNKDKIKPVEPVGPTTQTALQVQVQLPSHLNAQSIKQDILKYYLQASLSKKKICLKHPIEVKFFGKDEQVKVLSIKGPQEGDVSKDQFFLVGVKTSVIISFPSAKIETLKKEAPKFYGDNVDYTNFRKIVWENFKLREKLFDVKLGTIRGVLVSGPTGTGKSTFIKRLQFQSQNELITENEKIHFHIIQATQLLSRVVGGAQEYVRSTFKSLLNYQYSIFVIEDMHLLFGEKEMSSHETTLATLFSEMDNFPHALIVIGTYNSERELNSAIFQSGRFEKEISLNLPNHHQRLQILKAMFDDLSLAEEISMDDLKQFNLRLNGFGIGEIKQILRDAFITKGNRINKDILLQILKQYRPSEIKELIVEVPEVYWSGIGGYQSVKKQIRKVTQFPLKFPEKFQLLGIQPSKGVLLYGPPGCSKTMMAKAIATESKLNFIGIKGPQLFSKYVGESERAIRNVFRKARAFSPCIIFFDEIDALATQRNDQNDVTNRLLGQLLTEMDGVEGLKEVIIIAATNRPEILDEALTRPGRFDHLIYVSPPDVEARKQIFNICLKKTPLNCEKEDLCNELANKTQNYTGAEITLVCRQAAIAALEQNLDNPVVCRQNFEASLKKIKSRLTEQSIARYEDFNAKFNKSTIESSVTNAFGGLKINSNENPFKFT